MKVLFVPITEAQMDELQGLSEQGSLKASVFVTIASQICQFWKESPKILHFSFKPRLQDYNGCLDGFGHCRLDKIMINQNQHQDIKIFVQTNSPSVVDQGVGRVNFDWSVQTNVGSK